MAINGQTGPFDGSNTNIGGWGRNAARNVQKRLAEDPNALAHETIQYTNPNKPMRSDALGYAVEDIQAFDTNKNKSIDRFELRQAFGDTEQGNEVADAMFDVIDGDENGKIDPLENAAYLMFQDDSVTQTIGAIDAFQESTNWLSLDQANKFKQGLSGMSSQADNQVTPEERAAADAIILSAPFVTKQVLKSFRDFIGQKYGEFQKNNPSDF